jgi:hypothetical protein
VKLAEFFGHIGPYLLGQREHDETIAHLYGAAAATPGGPRALDAERLAIYARFCRIHRQEAVDSVFAYCRAAVCQSAGEAAWESLVERYFVAHPMHHFELNQNGEHFPEFLSGLCASGELPAFLAELADFEWCEWLTDSQPDADDGEDAGPLRLHKTVDLRPYSYDLVAWIDDDEREPAAPGPGECVVLFFRDRELAARRRIASPLELYIVKAVFESVPLDAALAQTLGIEKPQLDAAVAELHEAGVLIGSLPA